MRSCREISAPGRGSVVHGAGDLRVAELPRSLVLSEHTDGGVLADDETVHPAGLQRLRTQPAERPTRGVGDDGPAHRAFPALTAVGSAGAGPGRSCSGRSG